VLLVGLSCSSADAGWGLPKPLWVVCRLPEGSWRPSTQASASCARVHTWCGACLGLARTVYIHGKTVHLRISLPRLTYTNCIYTVLSNPMQKSGASGRKYQACTAATKRHACGQRYTSTYLQRGRLQGRLSAPCGRCIHCHPSVRFFEAGRVDGNAREAR
jgi:hypothetical protein